MKKICSILSTLLLIVLLAIAAVLIVPKLLGWGQYVVLSGSMEPKLPVGSIVIAKPYENQELKEGDIITYQLSGDKKVTHRVYAVNDDGTYITKGDANNAEDAGSVTKDRIEGIFFMDIPYLGFITTNAKSPLGIAAICGVLVVIILLNFLPDALSGDSGKKR